MVGCQNCGDISKLNMVIKMMSVVQLTIIETKKIVKKFNVITVRMHRLVDNILLVTWNWFMQSESKYTNKCRISIFKKTRQIHGSNHNIFAIFWTFLNLEIFDWLTQSSSKRQQSYDDLFFENTLQLYTIHHILVQ